MKPLDDLKRLLMVAVGLWLVMPVLWQVIQVMLPLIFGLLGLLWFAKVVMGKFTRW